MVIPDHWCHSIIDFNKYAIRSIFQIDKKTEPIDFSVGSAQLARHRGIQTVTKHFQVLRLCKSRYLISNELIAVDEAKIKASNNKKTNFSRKKLDNRKSKATESETSPSLCPPPFLKGGRAVSIRPRE